jgi:hydrogenase maturation factor
MRGSLWPIVEPAEAVRVLNAMKKNRYGKQVRIIGEVIEKTSNLL